jgi:mgtE-like transporter
MRRAFDWRRLVAFLGSDASVVSQSLVSLALNSSTSLIAGAVLGAITGTFHRLPGLLILVPPAIGLRGNVFSALGSRLSTSIHSGEFRPTLRRGTVLGDNVVASLLLTSGLALALAVVAKLVAVAVGVHHSISVFDLATISILGGVLASLVVLAATVFLASGAVRFGWDLDNLVAPIVSTLGDVLTLPALWAAAQLVDKGWGSTLLGWLLAVATGIGMVYGWRTRQRLLREIVRQSWPILFAALVLSTLAGVVIEKRFDTLRVFPALLVLEPAFVSSAGALGGIFSNRLSSGLNLGMVTPSGVPQRSARRDAALLAALALPIYVFNGLGAHWTARALGQASPGIGSMLGVSLLGAIGAVVFVIAVAYYGSIAAYRLRLDPDTYGVPTITSSVDFVGALMLVAAIVALGIT